MFDYVETDVLAGLETGMFHGGVSMPLDPLTAPSSLSGDRAQSLPVEKLDEALEETLAADMTILNRSADEATLRGQDSLLQGGLTHRPTSAKLRSSRSRKVAFNRNKGSFRTDASGRVEIDFLFDGSDRAGELAVFSLKGMDKLSPEKFARTAIRRALRGNAKGQVVIDDITEGAQFSGSLGERDFNRGAAASTKVLSLAANSRFAFLMVPDGTIKQARSGDRQALFSIPALNPGGKAQIGRTARGVYGIEDAPVDKSDRDFNDIVFRVKGARGNAKNLRKLISPEKNWLDSPVAQSFLKAPKFSNQTPSVPVDKPDLPVPSAVSDISTNVAKFNGSSTESEIIASGAQKIVVGTQTIYIGTEQVTRINQNPIIRSFDPVNPSNNWTRRDLENSGTDGRGLGLFWSGKALYGVFSVDGTQNDGQDFRRATGGAKQNWLKSYGPGGGGKIAVIGKIDPRTGNLLKAAHLSAITSSGKTNSLFVTGAKTNRAGNLVIQAKSFFSPRQPDGSAKARNPGSTGDSPFDYTIEITPDLSEVVSTSAPGWT